jgi:hypothetical protein
MGARMEQKDVSKELNNKSHDRAAITQSMSSDETNVHEEELESERRSFITTDDGHLNIGNMSFSGIALVQLCIIVIVIAANIIFWLIEFFGRTPP